MSNTATFLVGPGTNTFEFMGRKKIYVEDLVPSMFILIVFVELAELT